MYEIYTTFFWSVITTTILSFGAYLTRNNPILSGFLTAFPNKNLVYSLTAYGHLKEKDARKYIKTTLESSLVWLFISGIIVYLISQYI
tara:strand:- start:174 stop:437 length:264 start_codon:yes stop_codon:yes gene_type:complete